MAKSKKKKSVAQHAVGMAAIGLPQPVRNVVATRWGARLAIVVALALMATGVATLDWSDGWPKLKIDRQRAQEVRLKVRERVEAVAGKPTEDNPTRHFGFGQQNSDGQDGEKKTIGARIFKNR